MEDDDDNLGTPESKYNTDPNKIQESQSLVFDDIDSEPLPQEEHMYSSFPFDQDNINVFEADGKFGTKL